MSLDFMILGSLDGRRPIGPRDVVLERARTAFGIDLARPVVEVEGVRLEVSLSVEEDAVRCIHVTPRGGGDHERALRALAKGLDAVAFDGQTGQETGIDAPALPERVEEHYVLELVTLDLGDMGPEEPLWERLARSLGVSREDASASGARWSLRVELVRRAASITGIRLRAAWSDPAARDDLFARVVRCAEQNGWVPFDPQRNDWA